MIKESPRPKIGDIQIDDDKTEWIVVEITHSGISRVKRNSLAHLVHSAYSPEIAKTYVIPWSNR
jgi:hypothetical protein